MNIKETLKRVVASVAVVAVLEGVRGYLQQLLSSVTADYLYEAIKKDVDPWNYADRKVKTRGRGWASKLRKYKDRLTPDVVINWLSEDRPDLACVILNTPEGKAWLAKRVKSIKNRLWPPPKLKLVGKAPPTTVETPPLLEKPPAVRYG